MSFAPKSLERTTAIERQATTQKNRTQPGEILITEEDFRRYLQKLFDRIKSGEREIENQFVGFLTEIVSDKYPKLYCEFSKEYSRLINPDTKQNEEDY